LWKPVFRFVRAGIAIIAIGLSYIMDFGGGWSVLTSDPMRWIGNVAAKSDQLFFEWFGEQACLGGCQG